MATTTATFEPPATAADLLAALAAAPDAPEPAPPPAADAWEYESHHAPTPVERAAAAIEDYVDPATAAEIARSAYAAQVRARAARLAQERRDADLLASLLARPIRPKPKRLYPSGRNVDYRGIPLRNCYE